MAVLFVVHLPIEEIDINNSAGLPCVAIHLEDECDNKVNKLSSSNSTLEPRDECVTSQPLLMKPESMKDLSKQSLVVGGVGSRQTSDGNLANPVIQPLEIKKGDKVRFQVIPTSEDDMLRRSSSTQLQKSQPHIEKNQDSDYATDLEDMVIERMTLKEASTFLLL